MIKELLLIGNEALYKTSLPVEKNENVSKIINDLHDTLMEYRRVHKAGRAIAAPQIGVFRRILYMNIDDNPVAFINPVIEFPDDEMIDVVDDCMSFPQLLVKVRRHKCCLIKYYDQNWKYSEMFLENDLAELIQHEYDHLDGILATMIAIDNKAFIWKGALK